MFVDEKWFYLSQMSERYYLLPEEDEPRRTCKNKNYIPKIMFSCVCARPRFRDGEGVFDGKIGCFPLVTIERAIRRSGNHLRGDEVVKPIQSITSDVIRYFMMNKVLPAIRAKWPREDLHVFDRRGHHVVDGLDGVQHLLDRVRHLLDGVRRLHAVQRDGVRHLKVAVQISLDGVQRLHVVPGERAASVLFCARRECSEQECNESAASVRLHVVLGESAARVRRPASVMCVAGRRWRRAQMRADGTARE